MLFRESTKKRALTFVVAALVSLLTACSNGGSDDNDDATAGLGAEPDQSEEESDPDQSEEESDPDQSEEESDGDSSSAGDVTMGGSVTFAQTVDAQPGEFLSPAFGNILTQHAVFEPLTRIDVESGEPVGNIAESWEFSSDGLSLDVQLRDDVTFHSGRTLVAEDVLYTLEYIQDPDNAVRARALAERIVSMAAPSDHEVSFGFEQPFPNIFDLFETTPIVDSETFDDIAAGEVVIGTGPFEWGSWSPGGEIVLTKYADHRDAAETPLDEINIQIIPDTTALGSSIRSGQTQYVMGIPALDAMSISDEDGFEVFESGGSSIALGFDVTQPPFDNQQLRQAIHYAIDRDRIVNQVAGGFARATVLPWKESTAGYDTSQGDAYQYNPGEAAELAGGEEGLAFDVLVPEIPESVDIFEIVQNNLAAIGIDARPQIVSTAEYDERVANRDLQAAAVLMRNGNADSPATAVDTRPELLAENNVAGFESDEYTALIDDLKTAVEPSAQEEALAAYNEYFVDQAFTLTLITRTTLSVRESELMGLRPTYAGFVDLRGVWLDN